MARPPLPNPSAIFRPAEVVLVVLFGQPEPLAERLGSLTTRRLPTMALASAIPEIGNEQLSTMQTLALCTSLHRQSATLPTKLEKTPSPRSKNHTPKTSRTQRTTSREEDCCVEAFEEHLRSTKTRFSNRLIYTISKSPLTPFACLRITLWL